MNSSGNLKRIYVSGDFSGPVNHALSHRLHLLCTSLGTSFFLTVAKHRSHGIRFHSRGEPLFTIIVEVIGLAALLENKVASGRLEDLADVALLTTRSKKPRRKNR